jgi:hypothetical protein
MRCWTTTSTSSSARLALPGLAIVNKQLNERNDELERFASSVTGRELRMIELKQEVNELLKTLGRPPRYLQEHVVEPS